MGKSVDIYWYSVGALGVLRSQIQELEAVLSRLVAEEAQLKAKIETMQAETKSRAE